MPKGRIRPWVIVRCQGTLPQGACGRTCGVHRGPRNADGMVTVSAAPSPAFRAGEHVKDGKGRQWSFRSKSVASTAGAWTCDLEGCGAFHSALRNCCRGESPMSWVSALGVGFPGESTRARKLVLFGKRANHGGSLRKLEIWGSWSKSGREAVKPMAVRGSRWLSAAWPATFLPSPAEAEGWATCLAMHRLKALIHPDRSLPGAASSLSTALLENQPVRFAD